MSTKKKKGPCKKKDADLFSCTVCNKQFGTKYGLETHVRTHAATHDYSCVQCNYTCVSRKYLARHTKQKHGEKTRYKCVECGKMFHYRSKMAVHMRVHTGEKPHKCEECGKSFSAMYSLSTHRLIHTNEKPFACTICPYTCRDSSTLRKHVRRHAPVRRVYQCKECHVTYKLKYLLKAHVAEKHLSLDLRKYTCEHCGMRFREKNRMSNHIRNVHERVNECECEICGTVLSNKANLTQHLRTHAATRPYACAHTGCDKNFKDPSSLAKHTIVHYPERHHTCKVCGRKFTRRSRLKSHWLQHSRVKQLQCDYCGVHFYNKNYIAQHIQRKHMGQGKIYICDMCGLQTGNKPSLVMHIKYGHRSERDRKCKICKKKYKRNVYLKLHYAKSHNIRYKTKARKKIVEIKEEPDDLESIDLFEIEKEELFEDLDNNPKPLDDTELMPIDLAKVIIENNKEHLKKIPEAVFDEHYIKHLLRMPEELENSKSLQLSDTETQEDANTTIEKVLSEARQKDTLSLEKEGQNKHKVMIIEKDKRKKLTIVQEGMRQIVTNASQKERARQIEQFVKESTRRTVSKMKKSITIPLERVRRKRPIPLDEERQHQTVTVEMLKQTFEKQKKSQVDVRARQAEQAVVVEEARRMYNEKMRVAIGGVTKKDNIHIKYFNNNIQEKKPVDDAEITTNNNEINNDIVSSVPEDDNRNDINESASPNDKVNEIDDKNNDSSESEHGNDSNYSDDEAASKLRRNKKVNFNSHQCYICFNLYTTKEELINHCKDHFDMCSEKSLKKCPLCDYVFNKNISQHIKKKHNLHIEIPYARIKDRLTNSGGSRYYYEIDNPSLKQIEMIPSVKNLNRIACNKLDEKSRASKNKMVAKSKLVKKGKEWIVVKENIEVSMKDLELPEFGEAKHVKLSDSDDYLNKLKKLYHVAKSNGKKILFPCESCNKICQSLAALKLHNRKHDPNAKPFKPKVWKHKLKDKLVNTKVKNSRKAKNNGKKVNNNPKKVTSDPKKVNNNRNDVNSDPEKVNVNIDNRTAKPKPIVNKHKCSNELKEFYEKNIRGGDIEFWQFLKIYNKMGRENIKDFGDLSERTDFGIHIDEPKAVKVCNTKRVAKKEAFKRVVMVNRKEYIRRNAIKDKMREKIAKEQTVSH